MYIIALLVAFCLAICASAQDVTSVSTYYMTYTVMNVIETKTLTSSSVISTSAAALTTSSLTSSSWATLTTSVGTAAHTTHAVVASTGVAGASANGTASFSGASATPTAAFQGSASGLTASLSGAAAIAAILSLAQLL